MSPSQAAAVTANWAAPGHLDLFLAHACRIQVVNMHGTLAMLPVKGSDTLHHSIVYGTAGTKRARMR